MPERENCKDIFSETLIWICSKLESLNLDYMISGGSAVGFWGNIRTTMDIDIVVQIVDENISKFVNAVADEAYVDAGSAEKAVSEKGMFNIILNSTSFKIDIIVHDMNAPYEREKFKRKIGVDFFGRKIFVIAPEDLVISKLKWSRVAGSSERQLRDCESILSLNKKTMDNVYINKWIKVLGLEREYRALGGTEVKLY